MKTTAKDKNWLQNPNQMKNPKVFSIKAIRNTDGTFELLGGQCMVLDRKNQHRADWVQVDTRDFARELNKSKITSR